MDAQATTARIVEVEAVGHAKKTKMTDAKVKNLMPICAAKGLLEQNNRSQRMPSKITTQTKRDVIAVIQAMIAGAEKGICLRHAEIEHLRRKRTSLLERLETAKQQEPTDAE